MEGVDKIIEKLTHLRNIVSRQDMSDMSWNALEGWLKSIETEALKLKEYIETGEKKQYWFICYHKERSHSSKYTWNEVIDINPIQWQIDNHILDYTTNAPGDYYTNTLLCYREISFEEFEKYQSKLRNR